MPIFIDLGWIWHWSNYSKATYISVANNFILEDVSYILFPFFQGRNSRTELPQFRYILFHGKIWLCHLFYCFMYVFEQEKRNIQFFGRLSSKKHIISYLKNSQQRLIWPCVIHRVQLAIVAIVDFWRTSHLDGRTPPPSLPIFLVL